uniref:Uncharacterized protein n=1 Tax=Oryza punctata TaxID=4537 RepID=A0A0E0L0H1_ORYPU
MAATMIGAGEDDRDLPRQGPQGGIDGAVARLATVHSGRNGVEITAAVSGARSRAGNGMAAFPSLQRMIQDGVKRENARHGTLKERKRPRLGGDGNGRRLHVRRQR